MSTEGGNTYPAKWQKKGKRFVVYLAEDESVNASDQEFDVACDELCYAIGVKTGDGEAVLQLLREAPQPSGAAQYSKPALVRLGWNDTASGPQYQDGLFEGGYCATCRTGVGERTDMPLVVERLPKGNIGGFEQTGLNPLLVSADFVSLYTLEEVEGFGLQEVRLTRRSRRRFLEVNGQPQLAQVGVKGGDYNALASWQCVDCGYRSFSCTHPELPDNYRFSDFCCVDDLPPRLDGAFLIQDAMCRKSICMTKQRWNRLKQEPAAKGVLADRIYVLPREQVERDPVVRIEREF